jgi:hypothetical protein
MTNQPDIAEIIRKRGAEYNQNHPDIPLDLEEWKQIERTVRQELQRTNNDNVFRENP